MIKVPSTLFFLEAVISFSKAPHLTATQTSVLSGILFDGHFIPQNWSILEFQQSKLAASIAFVADIFCWILLKSHTLFFEHTSRFSALTSLKSVVFFVDCAQIGSAPPYVHTIFQQVTFRKRIGSKIKRPGHQWVKIEEEGRRRWGERLYSPESLSKLRVSWLAWTYSKPLGS